MINIGNEIIYENQIDAAQEILANLITDEPKLQLLYGEMQQGKTGTL